MARQSDSQHLRLALRVPRDEAANKIQARIKGGEELLAQQPSSDVELKDLQEKQEIWSDYNRDLLTQLFTSSAVVDEYSAPPVMVLGYDFTSAVERWRDSVETLLTRLRSIYGRMDLYSVLEEEAPVRSNPTNRDTNILVVHGSNNGAKQTVARFLENLGLTAKILHEQPDKGQTIIEKLVNIAASAGYAVVLLTGDDVGASQVSSKNLQPRARQNVLFEFGYLLGVLGRTRVCALREEGVEIPSDLSGLIYVPFDAAKEEWKARLAKEIKAAGININWNLRT